MTDNEALRVLESWLSLAYHYADGSDEDSAELYEALKRMFDLIARQKAEIDTLKEEKYNLIRTYSECQIANIKEFAERLKAIYNNDKCYDRPNAHTLIIKLLYNIDNLVKEMTERGK